MLTSETRHTLRTNYCRVWKVLQSLDDGRKTMHIQQVAYVAKAVAHIVDLQDDLLNALPVFWPYPMEHGQLAALHIYLQTTSTCLVTCYCEYQLVLLGISCETTVKPLTECTQLMCSRMTTEDDGLAFCDLQCCAKCARVCSL